MEWISIVLAVLGLCLFEVIISVDNAIINAEVLGTVSKKARKWFLFWGIIIAVFAVRGVLPWLIIWISSSGISPVEAFTASFSSDQRIVRAIEQSSPILLAGGGTFLVFLFFHWLFLEPKHYGLKGEEFIYKQGIWFFAVVSVLLAVIVWFAIKINPFMAFGAVIGSTAFFIIHGFRQKAEEAEKNMLGGGSNLSDISKILYLEVIDTTFSIDGILGSFAFTFSIPLILIGNGIGALVVRKLTISNIENVKKYKYLKNGAMYSVFALGIVMILDSFGFHIPKWISPLMTFAIVGAFFKKSYMDIKKEKNKTSVM